jgi:hypothetical protein
MAVRCERRRFMVRSIRSEFPGAFYHVTAHRDRRETIFHDDDRRFVERLNRRCAEDGAARAGIPVNNEEVDARCSHLRRGWYWGTQRFGEKMLALAKAGLGRTQGRADRSGGVRRSHDVQRAQSLPRDRLRVAGLTESDLAGLLWCGTTVTQAWIAERLRMRSAANVSRQLRRGASVKALPQPLRRFLRDQDLSMLDPDPNGAQISRKTHGLSQLFT